MKKYISSLLLLIVLTTQLPAQAAVSPISVTLAPPLQFPPGDFNVTGVRLGILGMHRNIYGLDIGAIGNITEQRFVGLAAAGLFNYTQGMTTAIGFQLAGLTNINVNKAAIYGFQMALGANINKAESTVVGMQLALANISKFTTLYGVQMGLYNRAQEVYGFQIGLINDTDRLHGIQIGLLNFNRKGTFVVAPIINIGF